MIAVSNFDMVGGVVIITVSMLGLLLCDWSDREEES